MAGVQRRSCARLRRSLSSRRPTEVRSSIHGSAELARRLSDAGLIDRYHLLVFPVLLGAGKSLFSRSDRDKQLLNLLASEAYPNGVVKMVYDVVG